MTILLDVVKFIVGKRLGISERELAEAIYGVEGYQQQVNGDCRLLLDRGVLERRARPDGVFGYWLAAAR